MNILVLDRYEKVIKWLHPDKTEIVETNKQKTQRTIQITYPLEHDITGDETQWFEQGNKIFIPETLGIDSCLYVINTQYSIDYWEKNVVTVSAEEVLTELNYSMFEYTDKTALKINKENLEKWFGDFYRIDTIDTLNSSKNTINPFGTMTKMSLLRLIEETTEYIFKTSYTYKDVTITRHLSLLKPENMRTNDPKHPEYYYINLSRNMESLELDVDETSTYTAMAPVLSLQQGTTNTTGTVTTTPTTTTSDVNNTGTSGTNADDIQKALKNWKALSVSYRESIPMIITQDSDGKIMYGAKWYAPFIKEKDSLYIYTPAYSNTSYNQVIPMNSKPQNGVIYPLQKIGTVQTSEKDPYAIYNTLANSLLSKTKPKFTLKVSVKDVQTIVGGDNSLGYQLYDTLYVKVPGFDYYVKCTVTETKKNPHLPGENTITVTSEVSGTHLQENTIILANDIKVDKTKYLPLQGNLVTVDNVPVGDALMNMSVTLEKTYTVTTQPTNPVTPEIDPNTPQKQAVLNFKPETEYYTFLDSEIVNMAKQVKNYIIDHNNTPKSVNMRATNGKIYRVPMQWCRAIYYARNQIYIIKEGINYSTLGKGSFSKSLNIHYYDNIEKRFDDGIKKGVINTNLFASWFYYIIQKQQKYIYNRFFKNSTTVVTKDGVSSGEKQNLGDCAYATLSNITESTWNYMTEIEVLRKCGFTNITSKTDAGFIPGRDGPKINRLGYKYFFVDATWDNLKKYVNSTKHAVMLLVNCPTLPYYQTIFGHDKNERAGHALWAPLFVESKSGGKQVFLEDSNLPVFTVPVWCTFPDTSKKPTKTELGLQYPSMPCYNLMPNLFVSWNTVLNSIHVEKITYIPRNVRGARVGEINGWDTDELNKYGVRYTKQLLIIQLQGSQRSLDAIPRDVPSDKNWDPYTLTYYISSTEIQRAYTQVLKEYYTNYCKKSRDTITTTIKDVNGNKYNVNGKWLYAMLQAYAYTYCTDYTHNKQEKTIPVGNGTDAMWYYNVQGTDRAWTSLTRVTDAMYQTIHEKQGFLLDTILAVQDIFFSISGTFLTIHELIEKQIGSPKQGVLNTLRGIVANLKLYWFKVDVSIANMKKYTGLNGVFILTLISPASGSEIKNSFNDMLKSVTHYFRYSGGNDNFSIFLYDNNIHDERVDYFFGIGAGNNPSYHPNDTDYVSCPWKEVPFSVMKDAILRNNKSLDWHDKMVVMSAWDEKTTKDIANGKIPSKPYDLDKGQVTK